MGRLSTPSFQTVLVFFLERRIPQHLEAYLSLPFCEPVIFTSRLLGSKTWQMENVASGIVDRSGTSYMYTYLM